MIAKRRLCLLVALGVLPRAAQCAPIEIDVPKYAVWCTTDALHPSADGGNHQGEELFNKLMTALSNEARSKEIASIGLPFVATITKVPVADHPNDVNVTVCAAVPQQAPAPGGPVIARMEPHRKGLAQVCERAALEACSNALEAAMKAAPWQFDQPALDAATRREHPALAPDNSADNVVKSLLHTKDILLGGPATEATAPALKTGKVVLAILVDVQEAPTSVPSIVKSRMPVIVWVSHGQVGDPRDGEPAMKTTSAEDRQFDCRRDSRGVQTSH